MVIKKSFHISSDLAQRLDDVMAQKPGLSFTFLVNEALNQWFDSPRFGALLESKSDTPSTAVKRSANIAARHVTRIEKMKDEKPGVNATLIVNQALWEWVKNPQVSTPAKYTDADIDRFIAENRELMDKLAE